MNERVRELIEQSRDLIQKKVMLGGQVYVPGPLEPGDVNLEKFAELIVRECVEVANNHFESKEPGYPGDKIEQHFGVE